MEWLTASPSTELALPSNTARALAIMLASALPSRRVAAATATSLPKLVSAVASPRKLSAKSSIDALVLESIVISPAESIDSTATP